MILVDTSVWIDHLHAAEPALIALLDDDAAACHPLVIQELALGSLRERETVLQLLSSLRALPVLSHRELLALVDGRRLWCRGLSSVDAHLMGSVLLTEGAQLWTRDKRLRAACHEASIAVFDEQR